MQFERIKTVRKQLSWSQKQLSIESGVAIEQISRYESGKSKPNRKVLERLAAALDVTPAFLSGSDDPNSTSLAGSIDDRMFFLLEKVKTSSLTVKDKKLICEILDMILYVKEVKELVMR